MTSHDKRFVVVGSLPSGAMASIVSGQLKTLEQAERSLAGKTPPDDLLEYAIYRLEPIR